MTHRRTVAALLLIASSLTSGLMALTLGAEPGWRPLPEPGLASSLGADANMNVDFVAGCESNFVAAGGNQQATCDGCDADNIGSICICCPNEGEANMTLRNQDPYTGSSGVDSQFPITVACGNAMGGTCQIVNDEVVCAAPVDSKMSCGDVTQYLVQSTSPTTITD